MFTGKGYCILLSILFITFSAYAQDTLITVQKKQDCQPKEIGEIIFKNKKPKPATDTLRGRNGFILPYIAYNPTKGFQLGAGGTVSWYVGDSPLTNQSAASAGAEFTSKDQKLFQLKSNVYTDRNKWFLQGDWRYYIYSLPTYGLGTGYNDPIPQIQGYNEDSLTPSTWDNSFQMKFKWLKLHEIFSYELMDNLYAGVGYHLDLHWDIEDEILNLDTTFPVLTPHYSYSVKHGFDPEEYITSGISLNFVYDTRDNLISPYKGYYVNVNFRMNETWLGSSKSSSTLYAEFRTYINLEKKLPRHLLAFWLYGGISISGVRPYFDLWATGFDQMNSSGKGYIQGRWRGDDLVYGEVQYRFPISRCSQVLGGVLFINASTASSKDQKVPLFGYIRPAGGVGLRITVDKASRTNILIDFTLGENSNGIYFSAQETF